MILGLGVDLVSNARIQRLVNSYGERFLNKIFCREELEYAYSKKDPYPHLAAAFATKEAFFKATRGYSPFIFKEICILRTKSGAPELKISGNAAIKIKKLGVKNIWVALSHEKDYTVSIVVLT